jgi:hypothetical protein
MQDRVSDLMSECKTANRLTEILTEKDEIFSRFQPPVRPLAPSIGVKQRYLEPQQLAQPVHRCRGSSVGPILFLHPPKEP